VRRVTNHAACSPHRTLLIFLLNLLLVEDIDWVLRGGVIFWFVSGTTLQGESWLSRSTTESTTRVMQWILGKRLGCKRPNLVLFGILRRCFEHHGRGPARHPPDTAAHPHAD
jgi:hypothetical protein